MLLSAVGTFRLTNLLLNSQNVSLILGTNKVRSPDAAAFHWKSHIWGINHVTFLFANTCQFCLTFLTFYTCVQHVLLNPPSSVNVHFLFVSIWGFLWIQVSQSHLSVRSSVSSRRCLFVALMLHIRPLDILPPSFWSAHSESQNRRQLTALLDDAYLISLYCSLPGTTLSTNSFTYSHIQF